MRAVARVSLAVMLLALPWCLVAEEEMTSEKAFKQLDNDGDGKLTREEFITGVMRMASEESGEIVPEMEEHFKTLVEKFWAKSDADGDGKFDLKEMKVFEYNMQHFGHGGEEM